MAPYEIWPFQPRAFLSDTRDMTNAEVGAYLKLLIHHWLNRFLPVDERALRRIAGMNAQSWKQSRARLKALFDDGWRHRRVERDLAAARKFHQRQRKAARARWHPVDNVDCHNPPIGDVDSDPKSLKNNGAKYAVAMPRQSHKVKQYRIPLELEAFRDVDNWPDPLHASKVGVSVPTHLNTSLTTQRTLSSFQRAQQKMLHALFLQLGEAAFADAINILATDAALLERATKAEARKAGGGVMAALNGLRAHIKHDELL